MKFQARDIKLRVVATIPGQPGVPGDYVVTPDTLEKGGLAPLDAMSSSPRTPAPSTDTVRSEIERVVKDLPTVTVKDPEGFAAEQKEQVNQFLYLIYGLLGLSVIIAILGRDQHAQPLGDRADPRGRAAAGGRRQPAAAAHDDPARVGGRRRLRWRSRHVMGVLFGPRWCAALEEDGLTELASRGLRWSVFLLLAGRRGVLAAVFPARRAARLDVLRAIGTE